MRNIYVIIFFTITQFLYSSSSKTIVLQLKWKHQFQFAGYYMAKEKGYYNDCNINLEIIEGSDICNPVDSVLNGRANIGIGGSELLIQRNQGKPIIALLSIFQHSPMVLIGKRKPENQNIHDVVGRRVMIENQSSEIYAYLMSEGIEANSYINFPYQSNLNLLEDDSVDFISAYITDEPYLLRKRNIDYQLFVPQTGGIDFYSDILFTSEKFAKKNSKEVDGFISATKKGWLYALSHIEETTKLIYCKYSQAKEVDQLIYEANESEKLIKPNIVEIGYMYNGRWQQIGNTYVKLGLLNKDFNLTGFLYTKEGLKPRFGIIYYVFYGIFLLISIIALIMISYFALNKFYYIRSKRGTK